MRHSLGLNSPTWMIKVCKSRFNYVNIQALIRSQPFKSPARKQTVAVATSASAPDEGGTNRTVAVETKSLTGMGAELGQTNVLLGSFYFSPI